MNADLTVVCFPRMVPTTVERLREGQGVLERVLRSFKVDRSYKRSEGSIEKESGMNAFETSQQQEYLVRLYRQPSIKQYFRDGYFKEN